MKIKYLGTAAAEGMPAIFCGCETCQKALKLGDKNIRTRSQAIIDGKIVVDWPADTYWHGIKYGINYSDISTLLITHSHCDHYYSEEFYYRQKGYSNLDQAKSLTVYGSEDIEESLKEFIKGIDPYRINYHKINAFQPFKVEDDYWITALCAQHGTSNPYIYLIEHQGKTLLYGNDTGLFPKETYSYLVENQMKLDFVSLDCTEGTKEMHYNGHMNLERCVILTDMMKKDKIVTESSVICLNHFSHNGKDVLYEDMTRAAEKYGFLVSYDGMELEF